MFQTKFSDHRKCQVVCKDESLAQQHCKEECDINYILRRSQKTGVLEHVARGSAQYGDFDGMDYHTACNCVLEAESQFLELPARVREKFNNDPGAFLDFASNAENRAEMQKLGLLNASAAPQHTEAQSADQASVEIAAGSD